MRVSNDADVKQLLEVVQQAISGLRYGTVEIVVHDSKVVQIERKEKLRLIPEENRKGE